jgi:predicted RNA methylase
MDLSFVADSRLRLLTERVLNSYVGRAELDSRRLLQLADEFYEGAFSEGKLLQPYLFELIQFIHNVHILGQGLCFADLGGGPIPVDVLESIAEDLHRNTSLLPTHTFRSDTKLSMCQFSTPPDYAFLAASFANLQPGDVVKEPSAGLGGLAVMVSFWGVKNIVVNELDANRAELLNCVLDMPGAFSQHEAVYTDGAYLHLLPNLPLIDVVLMNPPFNVDQGREDPFTAAKHVESALKVLRPGGRLVVILPGGTDGHITAEGEDMSLGMCLKAPRFKQWWKEIASQYTIRCDIGISRNVYKKYGTTIRTRLVVIDKTGPQASFHKPWCTGAEFLTVGEVFQHENYSKIVGCRAERLSQPEMDRILEEMRVEKLSTEGADRVLKHLSAPIESVTPVAPPTPVDLVDLDAEAEEENEDVTGQGIAFDAEGNVIKKALELRLLEQLASKLIEKEKGSTHDWTSWKDRKPYVGMGSLVDLNYGGKLSITYHQAAEFIWAYKLGERIYESEGVHLVLGLGNEVLEIDSYIDHHDQDWCIVFSHYLQGQRGMSGTREAWFTTNLKGGIWLDEQAYESNRQVDHLGAKSLLAELIEKGFKEAPIIRESSEPLSAEGLLWVNAEPKPGESEKARVSAATMAKDYVPDRMMPEAAGEFDGTEVEVTATINIVPDQEAAELDESGSGDVFQLYQPFVQVAGSHPHNVALVESNTMRMVNMPVAKHKVNFSTEVVRSGALSAVQLENVIYARNAHSQVLKDGITRKAFFIGDGTGVGKGRSGAGIVMDNYYERNGNLRVLWVTKEFSLVEATKRDWRDLGGDPNFVYSHSPLRDLNIALDAGIIVSTYSTMRMQGNEQDKVAKSEEEIAHEWEVYERKNEAVAQARRVRNEWKKYIKQYGYRELTGSELAVIVGAGGTPPAEGADDMPLIKSISKPTQPKPSVNRLEQIVLWNPDLIIFDESHLMGNAVGKGAARGGSTTSQRGLTGLELLARLPDARVVFMSATGATEVHNLGYAAERMGLCGKNVPAFPSVADFIGKITKAGMLGMELVAKDMKALGLYRATNLSYAGTSFELLEHTLAPHQRQLYDESCYYWRLSLDYIKRGFDENGTNSRGMAAIMSQFWGAAQRFYNQILISMQAPTAIAYAIAQLKAGHAVVVQLVNTNEAATERAVTNALFHEEDLNDLDITPKDALVMFIRMSFPTIQYEQVEVGEGQFKSQIMTNDDGDPIQNPEAIRLREELIQKVQRMRAPQGALDAFLEQTAEAGFPFAEITGRKKRYLMHTVQSEDSTAENPSTMRLRKMESRSKDLCDAEAAAFMNDELQGLIFSDAGNTGRSFQSDLRAKNQRRRVHIVLQPGWRADNAIQGMGRTHRTNQRVPPHYVLVTTDMPGQKRFVTSIARRIEQLGSLTKGNRRAANSGLFSDTDNLETRYALAAIHQIFRSLWHEFESDLSRAIGSNFFELQDLMGLKLVDNSVDPPQLNQKALAELNVVRFLNRLLFLPTGLQESLFKVFESLHESAIENAKQMGTFDRGVEKITAETIIKVSDKLVYADKETGARTRIVQLKCIHRRGIVNFEEMMGGKFIANNERGWSMQAGKPLSYVRNTSSGNLFTVWDAGMGTTQKGEVVKMLRMVSPTMTERLTPEEFNTKRCVPVDRKEFQRHWASAVKSADNFRTENMYLVTGAVLPVWDKLGDDTSRDSVRIYVAEITPTAETPNGERLIGREISSKNLDQVLRNLGVITGGLRRTEAELIREIMHKGNFLNLSNGWRLQRRRMSTGATRMVIKNVKSKAEVMDLKCVQCEWDGTDMVYVVELPASESDRLKIFQYLTTDRDPVQLYDNQQSKMFDLINDRNEVALEIAARTADVTSYSFDRNIEWHDSIMPWPPVQPQDAEVVEETNPDVLRAEDLFSFAMGEVAEAEAQEVPVLAVEPTVLSEGDWEALAGEGVVAPVLIKPAPVVLVPESVQEAILAATVIPAPEPVSKPVPAPTVAVTATKVYEDMTVSEKIEHIARISASAKLKKRLILEAHGQRALVF